MIPNESKIKEDENIKDFSPQKMEEQNPIEKNKKVKQCLPKFLTEDEYFKDNSNSLDEEESNEKKNVGNKKDNNSTQDDSNKLLNYSTNNYLYTNNNANLNNNINLFNCHQNIFYNENHNNLIMNQS